jgi:nucleoside-diphosphate-sugar epimerase
MTAIVAAALVTGATGFIGAALSRRLASAGTRTTCVVREDSAAGSKLAGIRGISVVRVSSFEPEALRLALANVPMDVVFHLASYGVKAGQRDPVQLVEGNVRLLERLLSSLSGKPIRRFVYTGSCSEYGPAAEPERLSELHPLSPASGYGAAKAAAEARGVALAGELGIPFVPLRLFGVYGVGEAEHRLIPYLVRHLSRGETPSLTGGEQTRDLTYIEDVVEALIDAATAPRIRPPTPYNVCSGKPVQIRAVARCVATLLGKPEADLGLGRLPYRDDEPMWIVGDPRKFHEDTGWQPRVDLVDGIRRVIASLLEHAR